MLYLYPFPCLPTHLRIFNLPYLSLCLGFCFLPAPYSPIRIPYLSLPLQLPITASTSSLLFGLYLQYFSVPKTSPLCISPCLPTLKTK